MRVGNGGEVGYVSWQQAVEVFDREAAALAKKIKQYLNEPDKLFRRVRDKFGMLQLSRNARAYHPGRGVYRSSYKNAMRLTRSETNMAYRTAEQTRWRQFDFVVGYEIKLSQTHPCHDVCDDLAGRYPKSFVWTGWHPMDRCYCVAILKTEEEFWRDGSEDSPGQSEREVTDVPQGFKDWVKDNRERIERAEKRGTQPYFIRDNQRKVMEILENPVTFGNGDAKSAEENERIDTNRRQYEEYGKKGWTQLYFDDNTGGYNVAHELHQFKNSKPKGVPKTGGEAEKWLGVQLANHGKTIEFLPESGIDGKSGDMRFDGKIWDCKYIPLANEKTIRAYFKDARKADCVIFTTCGEIDRYNDIIRAIEREIGRYKSIGKNIDELPDVYLYDKDRRLILIKKIKGT